LSGGAQEAMVVGHNRPGLKYSGIKISDMAGALLVQGKPQCLIEITVVKDAVPTDIDEVTTHEADQSSGIKGPSGGFNVSIKPVGPCKKLPKPAYGHVGDYEKTIKGNAEAFCQFFSVGFFDLSLSIRQERLRGIINNIENETISVAVTQRVEPS